MDPRLDKKAERREGTVKSRINYNKRVNLNQRNQLRNQSRKIRNNLLANRKQDARIGNLFNRSNQARRRIGGLGRDISGLRKSYSDLEN